ncbi:hypothetical protein [Robertmurraya korlensis]|uniref:hypothetical protein n=1 Tax=Robertmurraya korlensis TaxID=519977 RepID=UPI00082613AD|nr:hypothetical protein [Robertmurraya korlensis]
MAKQTEYQKEKMEEQLRKEDMYDVHLWKALEILKMPTKLGIDKDNNFVILYPVPLFKSYRVSGVEYKTNQAFILPDVLFDRLAENEDVIEAINKKRKRTTKAPDKKGRPSKYTEDDIVKWIEMLGAGMTYGQVATEVKTNANTIAYHVNKYKKAKGFEVKRKTKKEINQEVKAQNEAERLAKEKAKEAEKARKEALIEAKKATITEVLAERHKKAQRANSGQGRYKLFDDETVREWVELKYKEGLSNEEIADIYSSSKFTIRDKVSHYLSEMIKEATVNEQIIV